MPTLHLHTTAVLDDSARSALARALTELTAEVLGKRPEVTAVLLHHHRPGQWFIGGVAAEAQPTENSASTSPPAPTALTRKPPSWPAPGN